MLKSRYVTFRTADGRKVIGESGRTWGGDFFDALADVVVGSSDIVASITVAYADLTDSAMTYTVEEVTL